MIGALTYLVEVIIWSTAVWSLLQLILRSRSTGRMAARSRSMLVVSLVEVLVLLAVVRAVAVPPGAWSWLWLVTAATLGTGLAGAIRCWNALPWSRPVRSRGRSGGTGAPDPPARSARSGIARSVIALALGVGALVLLA